MVVGLDYRDVELSVHDLLQELKTHPKIRKLLEGGERVAWGAKTIPSGGFHALPIEAARAGAAAVRRRRRHRQHPAAQGRALRDRVGPARRRVGVRARSSPARRRARRSGSYDEARQAELHLAATSTRCATCARCSDAGFVVGGALASAMTVIQGQIAVGKLRGGAATPRQPLLRTGPRRELSDARRHAHLRQALVRLRLGQQDARRPAESHPHPGARAARASPSCGRACARRRSTRSGDEDGDGTVTVRLAPSNCVQCGAITAKGGRLTPPEGGSGPEYTLT